MSKDFVAPADILERIDLRRMYPDKWGSPVMVQCPAHSDHQKPNLGVYPKNVYCFHPKCGYHDGAFAFIRKAKRFHTMKEVLEYAVTLCSDTPTDYQQTEQPLPVERGVAREYHHRLLSKPEKLEWLERKYGLKLKTVKQAGVGYTNTFPYAYTLPVFALNGDLINIRFRIDPEENQDASVKYWGIKGRNNAVFYLPPPLFKIGADTIHKAVACAMGLNDDWLFLTEGEYDALALTQTGIVAISATNGASSLVGRYEYLLDELAGCRVAVCYDQDEVGREHGLEVALALKDRGNEVAIVEWNVSHGKDASELVAQGFPAKFFQDCITEGLDKAEAL